MSGNIIFGAIFVLMAIIAWPMIMPESHNVPLPASIESAVRTGKPVMLEFSATWCGPCQMVKPEVHKFAEEVRGRAEVIMFDVDQNHDLAQQYDVHGIPCFIVLKNGQEVARQLGAIPRSEMHRMLGL